MVRFGRRRSLTLCLLEQGDHASALSFGRNQEMIIFETRTPDKVQGGEKKTIVGEKGLFPKKLPEVPTRG